MDYSDLDDFLARAPGVLARGPVGILMAEDEAALGSTLAHHQRLGFRSLLLLSPAAIPRPPEAGATVHRILHDTAAPNALVLAVNRLIPAAAGSWLYYGYNAEYLFYPFCETRSVGELLAFHAEERRDAMLAYVIDLYAADLARAPNAVAPGDAHLDSAGYYALARHGPDGRPRERQLDFFGGLRRRYEEHVPPNRRRIDRIALFRARRDLVLRPDFTFSDEEYNTYACPWHNNLTAAVCSFRTAKALRTNPASRDAIRSFLWSKSVPFRWESQQLMDLGLMEPGQWF